MNLQTFELKLTCRFLLKRQYFPVPCHKHRLFMWFHGFGDTFLHLMPGLNVFCGLNSSQLNLTCSVALDSAGLNSFQWGDQRADIAAGVLNYSVFCKPSSAFCLSQSVSFAFYIDVFFSPSFSPHLPPPPYQTTFPRRLKHFSKETICLSSSTVSLPIMTIGSSHLNRKLMHSR